jgi:hypothetical protein
MGMDLTLHIVELSRLLNKKADPFKGETLVVPVQSLKVSKDTTLYAEIQNLRFTRSQDLAEMPNRLVAHGIPLVAATADNRFRPKVLSKGDLIALKDHVTFPFDKAVWAYLEHVPAGYVIVTEWH